MKAKNNSKYKPILTFKSENRIHQYNKMNSLKLINFALKHNKIVFLNKHLHAIKNEIHNHNNKNAWKIN
jgi:hypothetical protein